MPQWMEKVLLRSSIVIIIVLALVTVLNEMQWLPWRLPGLWRKRNVARLTDPQRAPRSWEELSALPLRAQGAALFHWVFAQLAARQLVHEQVAHTHREHAGLIATDMPAIAIPIHDLALAAERSIYASTDPSADEVEQWRDTARAIERELAEIKA
jgi:hypothetical protein